MTDKPLHKLLERQIKRASKNTSDGRVDVDVLIALVNDAYEEEERARKLNDRSVQLMSEEVMQLNAQVRAEAVEELRRNRDFLENVMRATSDGVWHWDMEAGDKLWLSPRWKEQIGYTDEDFPDTWDALEKVVHPDDYHAALELIGEYVAGRAPEYSMIIRFYHKQGHTVYVLSRAVSVKDASGKVTGMIGANTDITHIKAVENELRKARDDAQQASRAKSDFLANMSHEIRTPMNGIMGAATLLKGTQLIDKQKQFVNIIHTCSENLLRIINDILDISKIEAEKLEMEQIPFDMRQAVEEVLDLVKIRLQQKDIELILRIAPSTPTRLVGDPGRMRQIILNLASNAIKFTEIGHVLINVDCVKVEHNAAHLRIEVEDTGIGIPEDKRELIFESFNQADTSTTRQYGGTGLGLTISRKLVEMMRGKIGVNSEIGKGSTFWFEVSLPLDEEQPAPLITPDQLHEARFCVVDDNPVNLRIFNELLTSWGLKHISFSNPEEALQHLTAHGDCDIALIDGQMPKLDGFSFAKQLKAHENGAAIKMLMLTSNPERGDARRVTEAGYSGYLSKPFLPSQLYDAVCALWAERYSGTSGSQLVTRHSIQESRAKAEKEAIDQGQFTDMRVLVVEDNPVNQVVAVNLLEGMGVLVDVAGNGEEAVEMLRQFRYQLVLMDCQMPVLDGFAATRKQREMEEAEKKPRQRIVAMTANAMRGDRERCLDAGMDDYITKPVQTRDLIRMLSEAAAIPMDESLLHQASKPSYEEILPLVDMSRLNDLVAGKTERMKMIADLFIKDLSRMLHDLKDKIAHADWEESKRLAHSIKGASINVGAMKLHEAAKKLDEALLDAHYEAAPQLLHELAGRVIETEQAFLNLGGKIGE